MKRALLVAALLLASPLLAACPESKKAPVPQESGVVTAKRSPCGADGKCTGDEVNCWQLQIKRKDGKVGFNCVEHSVWLKYKINQTYP